MPVGTCPICKSYPCTCSKKIAGGIAATINSGVIGPGDGTDIQPDPTKMEATAAVSAATAQVVREAVVNRKVLKSSR